MVDLRLRNRHTTCYAKPRCTVFAFCSVWLEQLYTATEDCFRVNWNFKPMDQPNGLSKVKGTQRRQDWYRKNEKWRTPTIQGHGAFYFEKEKLERCYLLSCSTHQPRHPQIRSTDESLLPLSNHASTSCTQCQFHNSGVNIFQAKITWGKRHAPAWSHVPPR